MTDLYLHGTSTEEHQRLSLLNSLLNAANLEVASPMPGERVLEVGAGTGVFARAMAQAVGPSGSVLGIERDAAQLAEARETSGQAAIEFRSGDAYSLPLSDEEVGSFDLVHARFLLEHLSDPAAAALEMARAVRPGGRIALVDDDHTLMRFHPDLPEMDELWRTYYERFAEHGQDPGIGRRLAGLLVRAGLEDVRTAMIPFGACAQEPTFPGLVDNLEGVVRSMSDGICRTKGWDAARVDATFEAFRAWATEPEATIAYPLPYALGRRPLPGSAAR